MARSGRGVWRQLAAMPKIESLNNPSLLAAELPVPRLPDRSSPAFYSALSAALQKRQIRHMPFHPGGHPPDDLQLAIHPADVPRLGPAFAELRQDGYRAVQTVKLGDGHFRLVFARQRNSELESAALDLRFHGAKQIAARPGRRKPFRDATSGNSTFIVFLGPDGVGKTTLLRQISADLAPLFAFQEIYRWRPGWIAPTHHPACLPHSKPMRGFRGSITYLLFSAADFFGGYLFEIRRRMCAPALVIFDRYYHDLLIDPKRYRYNGPMWPARILGKLIPPRNVFFFVLDAEENAIFARKQQLSLEEIKRQRAAYRGFARTKRNSVVIETDQPISRCREQALEAVLQHLAERNQRLTARWFGWPPQDQPDPEATASARETAQSGDRNPALDPAV